MKACQSKPLYGVAIPANTPGNKGVRSSNCDLVSIVLVDVDDQAHTLAFCVTAFGQVVALSLAGRDHTEGMTRQANEATRPIIFVMSSILLETKRAIPSASK